MTARGLIIGAPSTGAGKTTITLGLLRALARTGTRVAPVKIGPDYIDPQFHHAASGRSSVNLDAWAMRPAYLNQLIADLVADTDIVVAEGVMGLFDGGQHPGRTGNGSTADLARLTGWPVILVVNCTGLGQSVAPLVHGFRTFAEDVTIAGVIANNVASDRHRNILQDALADRHITIVGTIPQEKSIQLPSRHLGLQQAEEHKDLDRLLTRMADVITQNCNLEKLAAVAGPLATQRAATQRVSCIPPFGQRIAVARDIAFRFAYPHILNGWRNAGAEIVFFSPLADETVPPGADAVYLPGGYPELHGVTIANATRFRESMIAAAAAQKPIYGECGGYMVLGRTITDADNVPHEMLGLLDVETSFATRKLHLGYRHLRAGDVFAAGTAGSTFYGHEFHYTSTLREDGAPLFANLDTGAQCGLRKGSVAGSFMHLIDTGE